MTYQLLDTVVLLRDLPEYGLRKGDLGAVVEVYDAEGIEVEFVRASGKTQAVVTLTTEDVRKLSARTKAMQAVVLSAKLNHLAAWNEARRAAARQYDELLSDIRGLTLPVTLPGNEHVWHLYMVRVPQREQVLQQLNAAGIGAGVHYPIPIHLQGAFKYLGHRRGDFPVAEAAADEILTLPLFPGITVEQQQYVARTLRTALS